MELTPRRLDDGDLDGLDDGPGGRAPVARRPRRWLPMVVIGLVLVAIGLFVYRGLSDAALYFRNADEAVAQQDSLGDRRFRLQGTVVDEAVREGGTVQFQVAYNDVSVDVEHAGDPPDLFRAGIPVVLEGHWSGDVFASDRILVKHDEEYQSKDQYEEREREAEEGGPQ
jgi:cytochrome c-type biogenesis protein CcmE